MEYRPTKRVAEILNWTLAKVQSVPYQVTMRWAFYRFVQELGFTKKDYPNFKKWTIRARKRFWNGWAPNTFVDDTREACWRGGGYDDFDDWLDAIKKEEPIFDKIVPQQNIVQLWFEAEAMRSQFEYFTRDLYVSLVPFKGDPSIDYKWQIAKRLEHLYEYYKKPIVILYFGDLDEKGETIPQYAVRDIRAWCSVPFEFIRVGIKPEHVKKWKLPENPEKPGTYQWESLSHEQAEELILGALENYWDAGAIKRVLAEEKEAKRKWDKLVKKLEVS